MAVVSLFSARAMAVETGIRAGYALGVSGGCEGASSAGISFLCQHNFDIGAVSLFPVVDYAFLTESGIRNWSRRKPLFILSGGMGVRLKPSDSVFLTFDFKVGCGSYLTVEDKVFMAVKGGFSCDFPLSSADGVLVMLSPALDYIRTPYSDTLIFGACVRIEPS